ISALVVAGHDSAFSVLYSFFWHCCCDWYIGLVKDAIVSGPPALEGGLNSAIETASRPAIGGSDKAARTRIITILEIALRMLHPFMPYLTEELWLKLPGVSNDLHHAAYT